MESAWVFKGLSPPKVRGATERWEGQVPEGQKGGLVSAEQGEQGRDLSSRQGKEAKGEGHGQGAVDRRAVL